MSEKLKISGRGLFKWTIWMQWEKLRGTAVSKAAPTGTLTRYLRNVSLTPQHYCHFHRT
jgi:hypothetical protein